MKKQLYFTQQFNIPFKLYIIIKNGKIREYYGANFTPVIMLGNAVDFPELELHKTDTDFNLIKISKYDRKELKIKANYKIECDYLFQSHLTDSYIKLNPIDKFRIDYSLKKSIFHKIELKYKITTLILIGLPTIYFGIIMKSCENQSPKKDIDQSTNPVLTTSNQDTIIDNSKARIHSDHIIKLERDSLNLQDSLQ